MADANGRSHKPEEAPKAAPEAPQPPARLSFTIDAASGEMVAIEAVDEAGARRALTAKEKTALAKGLARHTLRDILETTFEAGIASVLGDDDEDDDEDETADDAEARHLLLAPMIAASAARRFLKREVLGRAILAALLEQAPAAAPAKTAQTHSRASAATSSHRPAPTKGVTRH